MPTPRDCLHLLKTTVKSAMTSAGLGDIEACYLWDRYKRRQDENRFRPLLLYDSEEVMKLPILESRFFEVKREACQADEK